MIPRYPFLFPVHEPFLPVFSFCVAVDKAVHTGDKGQVIFWQVHEIVSM